MVTIKDVARESGVSNSTVSAVLADRAMALGIKAETQQKVRNTAMQLGYSRNAIASQMKSGRSNIMVFIIPECDIEFRATIKASEAAEGHDYLLKVFTPRQTGDNYVTQLEKVLAHRPAAVLHWGDPGTGRDYLVKVSGECRIPVVFMDFADDNTLLSIGTDDDSGINQAVNHLRELGHRRIAHVTDTLIAKYAEVRLSAFRRSMADAGLPMADDLVFHEDFNASPILLEQFIDAMVAMPEPPTAFCCASDLIALSVMTRLQGKGFRIPQDISIIGYADLDFCRYCSPALTTIRQPLADIGAAAVEMAINALNHQFVSKKLLLPTNLIIRGTTGPCRDYANNKQNPIINRIKK